MIRPNPSLLYGAGSPLAGLGFSDFVSDQLLADTEEERKRRARERSLAPQALLGPSLLGDAASQLFTPTSK